MQEEEEEEEEQRNHCQDHVRAHVSAISVLRETCRWYFCMHYSSYVVCRPLFPSKTKFIKTIPVKPGEAAHCFVTPRSVQFQHGLLSLSSHLTRGMTFGPSTISARVKRRLGLAPPITSAAKNVLTGKTVRWTQRRRGRVIRDGACQVAELPAPAVVRAPTSMQTRRDARAWRPSGPWEGPSPL